MSLSATSPLHEVVTACPAAELPARAAMVPPLDYTKWRLCRVKSVRVLTLALRMRVGERERKRRWRKMYAPVSTPPTSTRDKVSYKGDAMQLIISRQPFGGLKGHRRCTIERAHT